jgi:hypothetical protein
MEHLPNSDQTGRKPWWQVADEWRCPVVGTCLTMAEQRSILKKAKIPIGAMDDHEVHTMLVQSGSTDGRIARRVHRHLEKKFRSEIHSCSTYDEQALLSLWEARLRCGQIDALLWIAATHPCLSKPASARIFADVHMLMHQQGEAVRQELQQVEKLRAETQKLEGKLRKSWARRQELTRALHALEKECTELKRALRAQRQPEQTGQVKSLQARLDKAERRNEAQAAVIARLQAEKDSLVSELASVSSQNCLMRAELQSVLEDMLKKEVECQDCPKADLCGRRVLLVGGLTHLKAIYQSLVEDAGGEFKHHNGRRSGGISALKGVVGWADVVLCPVDFNSHRTCLHVKAICKKMDKPYHMMHSSGVSSVARALTE